jgi:hypothetical protein
MKGKCQFRQASAPIQRIHLKPSCLYDPQTLNDALDFHQSPINIPSFAKKYTKWPRPVPLERPTSTPLDRCNELKAQQSFLKFD